LNAKKKYLIIAFLALLIVSGIIWTAFQEVGNKKSPLTPIRVACIGDSITHGSEYPSDLAMLLGLNYSLENFGVSGATVRLDSNKPYMNQTAFQNAIEFEPKIVIIMLGTNDANPDLKQNTSNFKDDYITLIRAFQSLESKPKVLIALPPPVFNNSIGFSPEIFSQNIVPDIELVANMTKLPMIEVYSSFLGHPQYFIDGVHPTDEGAKIIANITYNMIISD
jgi:lysophospholipase L1-like esterase